jgi:histidinol-phosphate aminotransferase
MRPLDTTAPRPRLRAGLDRLPSYAMAADRPPVEPVARLALNESPHPPLPGVLDALREAAEGVNRYPPLVPYALGEQLARRLGVAEEQIAVGPGSVSLCGQLVHATCATPQDRVVFAWPSFEAYPILVQLAGATAVPVPLAAGGRHDLRAMAAAVDARTRLVFVCTPNNPTGPAVGHNELERFLDAVPGDVVVALDAAYAEFVTDEAAADPLALLRARPNVCVLRTLSKAYGLAGLRVGYAVAHPPVADALRRTVTPCAVTQLAQAAALAALAAQPETDRRVRQIVDERARVAGGLADLGWPVLPSQGNFVWLQLGEHAASFAAACAEQGVLVRAVPGHGVRISLGAPEENDALLAAAARLPRP